MSDLWSVIHNEVVAQLRQTIASNGGTIEMCRDGDGFYRVDGLVDVSSIASRIAAALKELPN